MTKHHTMRGIRHVNGRAIMFGRRVSPLAFWVGYFNVVLMTGTLTGMVIGSSIDTGFGRWIVVPTAVLILMMTAGFWLNMPRWMAWGLLGSCFLWLATAFAVLPATWNNSVSGWIALGLGGLTSWAWWIEEGDYPHEKKG